jgi:hypothetical protein
VGNHNNETIKKNIESSDVLVGKLADLEKKIVADLKSGFQELMGMAIPGAAEADLLKIDGVMKYSTELKIDEFLSGALTLAMAAFSGDEAEIATKAVSVATVAIKNVFGESGIQLGFKGDAAKLKYKGEKYVSALYASTSFCSATQWFTQTDFFVSKYVFTVFQLKKVASTRGALDEPSKIEALREL